MPWVVEFRVHDAALVVYICESHCHIDYHYEHMFSLLYAPSRSINIVIGSCSVKSGCFGGQSGTSILTIYLDHRWSDRCHCWHYYILWQNINCRVLHKYWGDHNWNWSSFLVFCLFLLFRLCNEHPMWNNERNGKDLAINYNSTGVVLRYRYSLWNSSRV